MLLRTRRFNVPSADALSTVQREMENLFGHVLSDASQNGQTTHGWRTPVAMWDDADKVFLELELPGVARDSLDVSVHKGTMRISGERKAPEGDRNYWVNDRVYGTFERNVALPEDVDADSIDARLTDGVLHIELSKRPEAQPKKITVRD